MLNVIQLLRHNAQPADPSVFIFAGPEGGVTVPESFDLFIIAPIRERHSNCLSQVRRQGSNLRIKTDGAGLLLHETVAPDDVSLTESEIIQQSGAERYYL